MDYGLQGCKESGMTEATERTCSWLSGHHLQLPASALSLTWLKENGGFYRVQKGSQVTDSDDGSPSMGHGTPRRENRCWENSLRFCRGGTFPTWAECWKLQGL